MYYRKPRVAFADYFSPAERSFTDWVSARPRSVLGSPTRAPEGEEDNPIDDLRRRFGFDARAREIDSGMGAVHNAGTIRAWGPGDVLLLGGDPEEEDNRPRQRKQQQGVGPKKDVRPEGPRDVHPPARPDPRQAECQKLQGEISSLRVVRNNKMRELYKLRNDLDDLHRSWRRNSDALDELEQLLTDLQYQLRTFDQPFPYSPPPNPAGVASDLAGHGGVLQLKRDIATVRRKIEAKRAMMQDQERGIEALAQQVRAKEAELREVETQLIEPERQHRLHCGPLSPWQGEWRR